MPNTEQSHSACASDMFATKINASKCIGFIVAMAKAIGFLLPAKNPSGLFFFFPFYHVGGAEKVHAAIVTCFNDTNPWVFFTKKSANPKFLSLFGNNARLFDVPNLLKYGYPFSIGIMAGLINRHKKPVVFGSNSLFYYLLLPYLKKDVRCVDVMHAFGGGAEEFSLPVADRLDARVSINSQTVADLKEQYLRNGLPARLAERVLLIENCVDVPDQYPVKLRRPSLKILYVGRGSEEKRVHLVGEIAARCRRQGLPVEVTLVGDTVHAVRAEHRSVCQLMGEVSDPEQLAHLYRDADLLLLTSSREGFPMVIMEAMAHGVVPVSTDVGGIPAHVADGKNGWLVAGERGEEQIVDEMCRIIERMSAERGVLHEMSRAAYDYAKRHFSGEKFCAAYRSLLLGA